MDTITFEVTSRVTPLQLEGRINGVDFFFRARGAEVFVVSGKVSLPEGEFDISCSMTIREALEFVKLPTRCSDTRADLPLRR